MGNKRYSKSKFVRSE